jgi:hypothetical protein
MRPHALALTALFLATVAFPVGTEAKDGLFASGARFPELFIFP